MTVYDSSLLIDYLDGDEDALAYAADHAEERAVTPPLVIYEVYQGEVFRSGPADFDAVDDALGWVDVVDATHGIARASAELQEELQRRGIALSARDAFVAGTARALDERLAAADGDFEAVAGLLEVDLL